MQLSVNGADIFVATGGRPFDPSLPTVVMLHGAGFDHSTWALHSRWFAHHGYSVLAPDLPAHGRSSGAPLPTIAAMADWTADLLDASGAPQAKQPATFMLGERDMTRHAKAGTTLAAATPNSRTVVLPGAGHMMMVEAPDELLAALRQVVALHPRSSP